MSLCPFRHTIMFKEQMNVYSIHWSKFKHSKGYLNMLLYISIVNCSQASNLNLANNPTLGLVGPWWKYVVNFLKAIQPTHSYHVITFLKRLRLRDVLGFLKYRAQNMLEVVIKDKIWMTAWTKYKHVISEISLSMIWYNIHTETMI